MLFESGGGHLFPKSAREAAYAWLRRWLGVLKSRKDANDGRRIRSRQSEELTSIAPLPFPCYTFRLFPRMQTRRSDGKRNLQGKGVD